ncbi:N-acetyltransferase 10 [Geopyxis carbonaria]|nr:N-acetyltransferase 10 [Geopyxis carbonaria]
MVKKAVDKRIPDLIRNGVQEKKRSFFVVVGDRGKDVILNLHYILGSASAKQNKSVLWAYKHKLLGFTSHRKKREARIKKEVKRGIREANTEDPFELFISLTDIRYVYYKETEKILGNTYGMCVLQDFEALTPNLLARTVETVEGGGLVVLLLKTMTSLKQLYTMAMDVHSRYRTEAHDDVVARFNERFILSLTDCAACLVVDDELNVLPISGGRAVAALPPVTAEEDGLRPEQRELAEIKESLADVQPAGALVGIAKTVDQAKAVLTFIDAIAEKTLRSTVALTAARGRGKSAALGIAIAAAVAHGYSNIFITSPSPENLKTLFEFIFKGFDALGYSDHLDYDILQSTNPAFNKAIVRVNIHRAHRQTIQYIQPQDAHVLGQAELVIIDEAAAIPLPLVRKLLGPYLVFMASTINGYEGTGRSLSLKLIQQLRDQSRGGAAKAAVAEDGVVTARDGKAAKGAATTTSSAVGGRTLREATLSEPIRYAPGDAVERWLNTLLCLDATLPPSRRSSTGTPSPQKCELFAVSRDTLFSYHPVSERFLQKMMALYVASHYKNSPNDLQLMSDAPAHMLFVLLPPTEPGATHLPDPLVVLQVALEGQISKQSVQAALSRGRREGGDMIPWLVAQQFQDADFASLSGARVVRIATNPDYTGMGYGSHALTQLTAFFDGKFTPLSDDAYISDSIARTSDDALASASLQTDTIAIRDPQSLPPLLLRLSEKRPAKLDYLGVSFGLTDALHKFWKRAGFAPVYVRQTPTELTGEHSCVMLRPLAATSPAWLAAFATDFRKRLLALLSFNLRSFTPLTPLLLLESANAAIAAAPAPASTLTKAELDTLLTPFDMKRLEAYADNMLDYHVILDLLPPLAALHFTHRLPGAALSPLQSAVLLAIGLQHKPLEALDGELRIGSAQVLSIFQKIVRKLAGALRGIVAADAAASLPTGGAAETAGEGMVALEQTLEEDLEEGGEQAKEGLEDAELKRRQRELVDGLDLSRYEVPADAEWGGAEAQIAKGKGVSTVVSVKSASGKGKRKVESAREILEQEMGGKGDGGERKRKKGKR